MLVVGFVMATAQQMAQAQSYEKRIGKTLDGYEREYYGLLPRVDKFESAAISTDTGGNITFLATSKEGKTTKLVYDNRFKQVFDYYILNYEAIGRSEIDLNSRDIDPSQLKMPVEKREQGPKKVLIVTIEGKSIKAHLAHCGKDKIALWTCAANEGFNFENPECLRILSLDSVASLHYISPYPARYVGLAAGLMLGIGLAAPGYYLPPLSIGGNNEYGDGLSTLASAAATAFTFGTIGYATGDIIGYYRRNRNAFTAADVVDEKKKVMFQSKMASSAMFYGLAPPEIMAKYNSK